MEVAGRAGPRIFIHIWCYLASVIIELIPQSLGMTFPQQQGLEC